MLPAGTLKSIGKIQHQTGRTPAGQVDPDGWADFIATPVRADILHQTGAEANRADSDTSIVKASIRIQYSTTRLAITNGMRFVHGSVAYDIKAVVPDERNRQHIDLVCETGGSNG